MPSKQSNKMKVYEKVDHYINALFAIEDKALKDTLKLMDKKKIPQWSISPNQGKFLQVLATMCNAKKILELGTLGGYSTIWLAKALPAKGHLISIEFDKKHAEAAKINIKKAKLKCKVEVRVGRALDILPKLEKEKEGPFDMIFVDADKPPYPEYFKWVLRLARRGTVIVFDNVVGKGKIIEPKSSDPKLEGVRRFNKLLAESSKVTATILTTVGIKEYDGMAIAVVN